jgi:glycosyltransferase involved in cell wall biosynthesis
VLAATDPRGITASEIERANAGVVVPAGDPQALLIAALRLSQDIDAASAYGAAGQRYCREMLSADAAMDAFERVVEEVICVRRDRRRPAGAIGAVRRINSR